MKKLSFLFLGGCCDFKKTCIEAGRKDFDLTKCVDFLTFQALESFFFVFVFGIGAIACSNWYKQCLRSNTEIGMSIFFIMTLTFGAISVVNAPNLFKVLFATSLFF